jgi:acyl carrier protein
MTFEEARSLILSMVNQSWALVHDPRFSARVGDPKADILFSEIEMDSLAAMEVCMNIEEETGAEIDIGDLAVYPSVNALAEHLATKR